MHVDDARQVSLNLVEAMDNEMKQQVEERRNYELALHVGDRISHFIEEEPIFSHTVLLFPDVLLGLFMMLTEQVAQGERCN